METLRSRLTIAQSKCAKSDSIRVATLGALRRMGLRLAAERKCRKLAEARAKKAEKEAAVAALRSQLAAVKSELAKARKASSRAA